MPDPRRPNPDATNWSGDLTRARRLQTLQLLVVSLLGIGVIVGGFVLGGRILSSQRTVAQEQSDAQELQRLRGELRQGYTIFLENRAQGRAGIDDRVKATFATGLVDINALRPRGPTDPLIATAIGNVDSALRSLGKIISGDYSRFPIGSPQDVQVRNQSTAVINQLDAGLIAWADRASALAEVHGRELQALTRQLIISLAAIVALFGLLGIVISARLARARTRIVEALFIEHAARGAVISSVQDGLAVVSPAGRIVDMNDRLSDVTGFSEAELRSATGVIPYLAGTNVAPDMIGERDLHVRRPDGTEVPVILSSAPLTTAEGANQGRVHILKDVTERKKAEMELRTLAMEQAALRRAATAVASESSPEDVFTIVAREVALLLGAQGGMVSRFDRSTDRSIRVGAWLEPDTENELPPRLPLAGNVVAVVYRGGIPARVEDTTSPPSDIFARHGFPVSISAPVRVGAEVWGAVTVAAHDPHDLPPGSEVRLARFAELVGITVANADARARLARQAATDALTGLSNHRTFHERLAREVQRARSAGSALSVVVFDLDHFKAVNDAYGHQIGDRVLAEFGRCLANGARYEELVARIGGEEFAWILPGSNGENALRAAERVRATFGEIDHPEVGRLTSSAGVCDLTHASDPETLLRLADGALYWAKSHGRNNTTLYAPEVVEELSDSERAERLTRSQAKTALRTLTRLIDAKDPATARHTERVATLAAAIAGQLGWSPARIALLEEAALFHDIGKIVVPDDVLFKVAPLTTDERARVESHVALGAELVDDVLQPEQIEWIRGHHEKWDGTGYPDRLAGDQIPLGAQIIHVADAWDAMTSGRPYQQLRSVEDAVRECRAMAGSQFAPRLVETLLAVVRNEDPDRRPDPAGVLPT